MEEVNHVTALSRLGAATWERWAGAGVPTRRRCAARGEWKHGKKDGLRTQLKARFKGRAGPCQYRSAAVCWAYGRT